MSYFSYSHVSTFLHRKINTIALLSVLNRIEHTLLAPHLPYIIKIILPEVELYNRALGTGTSRPITGIVDNSPNLRFGTNVLSQRKESIRRED